MGSARAVRALRIHRSKPKVRLLDKLRWWVLQASEHIHIVTWHDPAATACSPPFAAVKTVQLSALSSLRHPINFGP